MVQIPTVTEQNYTEAMHDYGMANGHSPVAEKVVCIDFDGTLVPWGDLMGAKEALPGAKESIDRLKAAGYRIVIFTSRLSAKWAESVVGLNKNSVSYFLDEQRQYVAKTLENNGITFDSITGEKIPAEIYVDDKAVYFNGNWNSVSDEVMSRLSSDEWITTYRRNGRREHRISGAPYRSGGRWMIPVRCGHNIKTWNYRRDVTPDQVREELMRVGQISRNPSATYFCGHCVRSKANE